MVKEKKENLSLEEKLSQTLVLIEEHPYEIPDNWCWIRMETVCEGFQYGYTEKAVYEEVGPKYIRITDIGDGIINADNAPYCPIADVNFEKYKVRKNDILIARMGSVGENGLSLSDLNAVFASYLIRLIPKISAYYISYFLQSNLYWEQIAEKSQGTTRLNVNANVLKKIKFPLAPKKEQQRIVEQIENLFSKLDEAKEKTQDVLDTFATRKTMILYKAFQGELTRLWRKENNKSEDTWKASLLSECSSAIGDGLHGTPVFDTEGEYYFINGNNFEKDHIQIKDSTKKVNEIEYIKHYIQLYTENTVFVSINGTLGKTAFYNGEPIILGKSACYINVSEDLNKFYLRYFLESKEFIDYANHKATGSTIKNLGLKSIRDMIIPVPSIEEQKEIVSILDKISVEEDQTIEIVENTIEKIDLIKKAILAKAFRGELGTNDSSEPSSIELLKEIL